MQGQYSLRSPAVKRLMREANELKDPTEQFYAQPLEDNLFEWHFTIRGPVDSEFDGGIYHGRIILPPEYPMKPPSIIMLTPNGRFEVHKKICLSISGHHPESWQPSWSIRTAMLAIIGFMPTHGSGAIGSLDYTPEERKRLARRTKDWKCPNCGRVCDVLLPVTEASKATSQEAKELASQIDFQGEKESKNNSEKAKSEEASPAPEPTPSEPSPAPNPNMMGMFGQPSLPPGMQMPLGMTPAMMGAMGANQPPRFPPQLWPPMFRPPMNPRGTGPPAPGMQPPMFWPPGFMAMMQMQRGGLQPPQQQASTASPGPSSPSSSSSSSSTPTVSSDSASASNSAQNQNQPPAAEKPAAQSQVTTTPAASTSTSQVPTVSSASPASSSQTSPASETPPQTAAAAAVNPQAPSSELRQRTVQPQPRVNTTPQPVRLIPPQQQQQQQQASSPVILTLMFVIGLLLLALLLRRLYLLYLRDIVGSSADEL